MKRTPLRRQRATPRRQAPERVAHVRIKPKAGSAPSAQEKRHIARIAALPCLVSGKPATVHHVTAHADRMGRIARSHRRVVPLAPEYHQKVRDPKAADPISVEGLGHRGFFDKYGIDLLAEADRLWLESEEMERCRKRPG